MKDPAKKRLRCKPGNASHRRWIQLCTEQEMLYDADLNGGGSTRYLVGRFFTPFAQLQKAGQSVSTAEFILV